ncbi:MAG: Hpt domain-containing protein [Acidobacteriota bacterium]
MERAAPYSAAPQRSGFSPEPLQATVSLGGTPRASVIEDTGCILAIVGGDMAFLEELIEIFQGDIETQIDALCAAIESRSATAAAKAAHSLRGSVANFSCSQGAGKAFMIEEALMAEQWPVVRTLFVDLCQLLDALLGELRELVAAGH